MDWEEKSKTREKTHACRRETCNLLAERPEAQNRTLLQSWSATNCATVLLIFSDDQKLAYYCTATPVRKLSLNFHSLTYLRIFRILWVSRRKMYKCVTIKDCMTKYLQYFILATPLLAEAGLFYSVSYCVWGTHKRKMTNSRFSLQSPVSLGSACWSMVCPFTFLVAFLYCKWLLFIMFYSFSNKLFHLTPYLFSNTNISSKGLHYFDWCWEIENKNTLQRMAAALLSKVVSLINRAFSSL